MVLKIKYLILNTTKVFPLRYFNIIKVLPLMSNLSDKGVRGYGRTIQPK